MNLKRFTYLLDELRKQDLDESDWNEFLQAVDSEEYNEHLTDDILLRLAERRESAEWTRETEDRVWNRISKETFDITPVRRMGIWKWVGVAAAVVFLLGTGYVYIMKGRDKVNSGITPDQKLATTNGKTDAAPGTNKAILTLSGGQQIVLDSAKQGEIAAQGQTSVIKSDSGKLIYSLSANKNINAQETVSFNTLSTPRGGIYTVTLPDGTNAWLNAASSITYPTKFTKSTREVSITGEVYFEVALDSKHPFLLSLRAKTQNARWPLFPESSLAVRWQKRPSPTMARGLPFSKTRWKDCFSRCRAGSWL